MLLDPKARPALGAAYLVAAVTIAASALGLWGIATGDGTDGERALLILLLVVMVVSFVLSTVLSVLLDRGSRVRLPAEPQSSTAVVPYPSGPPSTIGVLELPVLRRPLMWARVVTVLNHLLAAAAVVVCTLGYLNAPDGSETAVAPPASTTARPDGPTTTPPEGPTSTPPGETPSSPSSSSSSSSSTSSTTQPTTTTTDPDVFELDFANNTHIDLDARRADREGGAEYEMELDFGRLFFAENVPEDFEGTVVKYVDDSEATLEGCTAGTLLQDGVAHLSELGQRQSICVLTSEGAWVAMKVVEADPSGSGLGVDDVTFAVEILGP